MRIYGQEIEEYGNIWVIPIKKPIYDYKGSPNVAINEKIISQAIKKNKILVIDCKGYKPEQVDPRTWKKRARRIEKVFRFPDNPMVMYQGHLSKGGDV